MTNRSNPRDATPFSSQSGPLPQKINPEVVLAKIALAQSLEVNAAGRDPQQAFTLYLELAKEGIAYALPPLERLGEELGSTACLKLSQLFDFFKNKSKAAYWQDLARKLATFDFKEARPPSYGIRARQS